MSASTTDTVLPGRQVRWTPLGARMGYTNTPAKRAAIRAAVEAMDWVEPDQLRDVLDTPIIRLYLTGLLSGSACALHRVAVASIKVLPAHFPDSTRPLRLVGLESVTGARYVLLDLGYEAIDLIHATLTADGSAR